MSYLNDFENFKTSKFSSLILSRIKLSLYNAEEHIEALIGIIVDFSIFFIVVDRIDAFSALFL